MSGEHGGGLRVAVVGATGLVGREIVSLLAERRTPVADLRLYASDRSAGEEVDFGEETLRAERLPRELPDVDLAFLCADAEVSRSLGGDLAERGAVVVDLTPAHRSDPATPLLVAGPEASRLDGRGGLLVALPDAAVLLLAAPLQAIRSVTALRRVIATVLVSASAFGRRSVEQLGRTSAALLGGGEPEDGEPRPAVAFSAVPGVGAESASRAREVERDLRRVLRIDSPIAVSLVRAPAFHGHAASVSVEISPPVAAEELHVALRQAPSVVLDKGGDAATGTREALGSEAVHVGGVRIEPADPAWVHFWLAADNVRQGAALNAVAVAEALTRSRSGIS
ncbi:MAG: Asd/ArgC dimerization domain-containing protein [Candidatus Binatia bacterium]